MRKIAIYLKTAAAFLYAATMYPVGYLLYVLSGFIRSLAFLLMLSPRSFRGETRAMFRVYRSIGDSF